jgi:hypothetical protein
VRAREKAEKTLGANGADGISNIEGKIARVATSKLGNERVSIFNIRAFHDAVLELGSVPLPVATARVDRFIAEDGKGPYRIWSEWAAVAGGADAGSSTSQPEETDQPTYPWSRS